MSKEEEVKVKHKRDYEGEDTANKSCNKVVTMLSRRPWTYGRVIRTKNNSTEDKQGVDVFYPVDERLEDLLWLSHDARGMKVQVKSSWYNENDFYYIGPNRHRVHNLVKGENIFILNGREEYPEMMASLVAQMVTFGSLSGVPEDVVIDFLASDLGDEEIVEAYIDQKEKLIEYKWFGEYFSGGKINGWKKHASKIQIMQS